MKGIDISTYNGNIDFSKVKQEVDYVILRLGWIGNKNNHTLDEKFNIYYKECKKYQIPIGLYVYNYCNNETSAKEGANWTLEKIKDKYFELPIYIDMEDNSIRGFGKQKLTNIVITYNTILEKANRRTGVYANLEWFKKYLYKDILASKYSLWIAHYGLLNKNKYKGQYDMLQYTSKGKINGIKGNVDTNIMYKDLILKANKYNAGQIVEIDVPIVFTGAKEGQLVMVDNGYNIFWVNETTIKNNHIVARVEICYANGQDYMVQLFDNIFWIKEKDITKKLQ